MTKKDIAKRIAEATGVPQMEVQKIVQMVFDGIIEVLVEEGTIELRNFGVFKVKKRRPRKARNPRTGEAVRVPARKTVRFKPGREMMRKVGEMVPVVLSRVHHPSMRIPWTIKENSEARTESPVAWKPSRFPGDPRSNMEP